jgi:dTDP-4-dehydrorhamnose 3,5-epimerase
MHFHLRQVDLWIVLDGRAQVGLVDLRDARSDSSWRPRTALIDLGRGEAVFIPERVAHGFYALEELSLLYLVTNEFDGRDEHGFAWDDPALGLQWPAGRPILSPRDGANPPLREVVARLGQGQIEGA